jgi:uncharacterized tellurite resistance protein B-like protein
MFNRLKNILLVKQKEADDRSNSHGPLQTRLATAIVLLEAAHADDECTRDEMNHIFNTIKSHLNLSNDCAQELIALADETREHEVDLWQFTNHINQVFSQAEKIKIIENAWEIILLDGHLEQHEDHFIHKLANLLRLTHRELIDAKMKVKQR